MKYFKVYKRNKYPIVCNLPHSSTRIPLDFRDDYLIRGRDLYEQTKLMADLYTKELYGPLLKKYGAIMSDVSRILVDIERFEDDKLESMSRVGMGALYEKTDQGSDIRSLKKASRSTLVKNIYRPYHQKFTELVEHKLESHDKCLIIDCHSFPSEARAYEPDKSKSRPDICIGTDSFHTPKTVERQLYTFFKKYGYSVKINKPFSGTIVPIKYYQKEKKVSSVMIELNRKLYMDESNFQKRKTLSKHSKNIAKIVSNLEKIYGGDV